MSATTTLPVGQSDASSTAATSPKGAKSGKGNVKFQTHYSLPAARLILLNGSRGVKFGGGTQRIGMIARELLGFKFGTYRPSDALPILRHKDWTKRVLAALEAWVKEWDPAVSDNTQKMREGQYKACKAFIAENGFTKIADAIESMLAMRSNEIALEDNAGNVRKSTLIDACDLFLGIRLTAARAASLRMRAA